MLLLPWRRAHSRRPWPSSSMTTRGSSSCSSNTFSSSRTTGQPSPRLQLSEAQCPCLELPRGSPPGRLRQRQGRLHWSEPHTFGSPSRRGWHPEHTQAALSLPEALLGEPTRPRAPCPRALSPGCFQGSLSLCALRPPIMQLPTQRPQAWEGHWEGRGLGCGPRGQGSQRWSRPWSSTARSSSRQLPTSRSCTACSMSRCSSRSCSSSCSSAITTPSRPRQQFGPRLIAAHSKCRSMCLLVGTSQAPWAQGWAQGAYPGPAQPRRHTCGASCLRPRGVLRALPRSPARGLQTAQGAGWEAHEQGPWQGSPQQSRPPFSSTSSGPPWPSNLQLHCSRASIFHPGHCHS